MYIHINTERQYLPRTDNIRVKKCNIWQQCQATTVVTELDYLEIIILKKSQDQIRQCFQLGCESESNVIR
jgi:hypothetical protein